MVRVTMILLSVLLAAAAAGRYKAEVSVREKRTEIRALEEARELEVGAIQVLRAEMAYLESPERLAKVAGLATALEPLNGAQLRTADEFLAAFESVDQSIDTTPGGDAVAAAIALASAE